MSLVQILLLTAVAFGAGLVDAIAGGGGLLTVPALLAAGLPAHIALGTNKGQSVFGSGASLFRYWRAGWIHGERAKVMFPAGFVGALAGVALVLALDPSVLKPIVLALLVVAGVVVAVRRPSEANASDAPVSRMPLKALLIALTIGAYDGFFGPGTGTFLIVALVSLIHLTLAKATAEAKVVNFASNLASVVMFSMKGIVLWKIAAPMAVGQLLGGIVGAHMAIRHGGRLIRWVVLAVVFALVMKLSRDVLGQL